MPNPLLRNSIEAFNRVRDRWASKNLSPDDIRVPVISGRAAASLVTHLKKLDDFKARSLSTSGRKVVR